MSSQLFPNYFMHEVLGFLFIAATCVIVWLLATRGRTARGTSRRLAFAALPIVMALGLWGTIRNLTWQPGLPDIIYAKDGGYQWGSGFADYEPANPCLSVTWIKAHGMTPLRPVGYVAHPSYGGDAWTAQIGARGRVPVYRGDRWDLVVVPRPGCYVVFTTMG